MIFSVKIFSQLHNVVNIWWNLVFQRKNNEHVIFYLKNTAQIQSLLHASFSVYLVLSIYFWVLLAYLRWLIYKLFDIGVFYSVFMKLARELVIVSISYRMHFPRLIINPWKTNIKWFRCTLSSPYENSITICHTICYFSVILSYLRW